MSEELRSLQHDEQDHRYVGLVGGEIAALTQYRPHPEVWDFIHTETRSGMEHHGFATEVVEFALDDVSDRGLYVRPFCPFVRQLIAANTGYLHLVRESDRAQFDLPATT